MRETPEILGIELEVGDEFWTAEQIEAAVEVEVGADLTEADESTDPGPEFDADPEAIVEGSAGEVGEPDLTDGNACNVKVVGNAALSPFCRAGRILFTQGGVRYTASAAAIGDRVVITWAGVLWRNGAYSTDVQFLPGWPDKNASGGKTLTFRADRTRIFEDWQKGDRRFGYGMIRTSQRMKSSIGHFGLAWNQTKSGREWEVFAHPRYSKFKQMWTKSLFQATNQELMVIGNDNFDGGGLGAPWATGVPGYGLCVNGVQVGQYGTCRAVSPAFDHNAKRLYDATLQ